MRVIVLVALSCALLAGTARAADPLSREAMEPRQLAAVVDERRPVKWMQEGFDEMAASLERARVYEAEAKQRGAVLSKQTRPAQPVETLAGKCVPFQVPAPHKSMQDYCRALLRMPWKLVFFFWSGSARAPPALALALPLALSLARSLSLLP